MTKVWRASGYILICLHYMLEIRMGRKTKISRVFGLRRINCAWCLISRVNHSYQSNKYVLTLILINKYLLIVHKTIFFLLFTSTWSKINRFSLYITIKRIEQAFQIYNYLLTETIIKRIIWHQRREHWSFSRHFVPWKSPSYQDVEFILIIISVKRWLYIWQVCKNSFILIHISIFF
jgi:hypothetical protein